MLLANNSQSIRDRERELISYILLITCMDALLFQTKPILLRLPWVNSWWEKESLVWSEYGSCSSMRQLEMVRGGGVLFFVVCALFIPPPNPPHINWLVYGVRSSQHNLTNHPPADHNSMPVGIGYGRVVVGLVVCRVGDFVFCFQDG